MTPAPQSAPQSLRAANLGRTALPRRSRTADPMQTYDRLPPALRHWLAHAARPWSPASCLAIWRRSRARGCSPDEVIARLARAEAQALRRDAL